MRKRKAGILLFFVLLPFLISAEDFKATTVILVSHAEKQSNADDPELSAAGKACAQELARILEHTGIRAIYTSQYLRTKATAAPLAEWLKTATMEVDASKPDLLVQDILAHYAGQAVLVVGHSNTIPDIIAALGAKAPSIEDMEYDNLYVVTIWAPGKAALVRLKYGKGSEANHD